MGDNGLIGAYVRRASAAGQLVVQPRMGMARPETMADGLRAVAGANATTVGTLTLDSYTRVGDHAGAMLALSRGSDLNGFPIVAHGPEVTAEVVSAAGRRPVQVRHGSAVPEAIFEAMVASGLSVTEGGPVSYCLPYGRTPLAESVARWKHASQRLADECDARGQRAHIETFGGCLLGQLCPPSLLVATSVLEGLFFAQQGVSSISLSYAQQTHGVQDVEALATLRCLADELLPATVDWHIVLYTYMGVYPSTELGARLLLDRSAELAVRGRAERLIVKTAVEAHRLPTVEENIQALEQATATADRAHLESDLPSVDQVDYETTLVEARAIVEAVLNISDDVGTALLNGFSEGLLDVPFCLHRDNRRLTQGGIDTEGRLCWVKTGKLPLPAAVRADNIDRIGSQDLLRMLRATADRYDLLSLEDNTRELSPLAVKPGAR